jgi:predicted AAA+ superfamily ATPase
VSREAQVSRKTVEGYLEILEDLLLGFRIDVFTRRAKRELAAHPKFYFFDTGVFRAKAGSQVDGKERHDLHFDALKRILDRLNGDYVR